MSVARSGTLALFVAFLVMWLSWPKPLRARALFTAIVGTVGMRLLIPGLLGTIRALFTNIMYDPSTQGRTEDYGKVGTFIGERPFFGRGFLTFVPERYFVLDNQYLGLLIETGFVGLVAFVLFFAVGIRSAWRAKIGGTPEVRSLGQAHVASLLALLISAGTFDVLAFTMVSGVVFLLVGTSGALWRLTEPERDAAQQVRQTQHVEADLDADFDAYVALATQEREPEPFDVTRLDRSTLATMINRLPRVEPRSTSSTPSDRNDE
jgi:O-antigen ligase